VLIRCTRGTNLVESIHRQYNTTFRHRSGIEAGDALLATRRHRHNVDVARRVFSGYPNIGHYDTWRIDLMQELYEAVTGNLLFPCWVNVSDYQDTEESFTTVPIHDEEIHQKLEDRVAEIEAAADMTLPIYSGDMKHLCRCWTVKIPFLPMARKHEFQLFSRLMFDATMPKFDARKMALKWMESVDGISVFPKLEAQLRQYYRSWERNQRIKNAMEKMRKMGDLLAKYTRSKVPADMILEQSRNQVEGTPTRVYTKRSHSGLGGETRWFQYGVVPAGPLSLPETMRRRVDDGPLLVGMEPVGVGVALPEQGMQDIEQPAKKRQKCRCTLCVQSGNLTRVRNAGECPGARMRMDCPGYKWSGG